MAEPVVGPAAPTEIADLTALIESSVPLAYRTMLREPMERALKQPTREERVLVARDRRGGSAVGLAVYGEFAGASGAGRIRGVAVSPLARRRGIGRALISEAVRDLTLSNARFVLVELPDEPDMRFCAVLLEACGFREEARARDLVADGVAMRFLRRELQAP